MDIEVRALLDVHLAQLLGRVARRLDGGEGPLRLDPRHVDLDEREAAARLGRGIAQAHGERLGLLELLLRLLGLAAAEEDGAERRPREGFRPPLGGARGVVGRLAREVLGAAEVSLPHGDLGADPEHLEPDAASRARGGAPVRGLRARATVDLARGALDGVARARHVAAEEVDLGQLGEGETGHDLALVLREDLDRGLEVGLRLVEAAPLGEDEPEVVAHGCAPRRVAEALPEAERRLEADDRLVALAARGEEVGDLAQGAREPARVVRLARERDRAARELEGAAVVSLHVREVGEVEIGGGDARGALALLVEVARADDPLDRRLVVAAPGEGAPEVAEDVRKPDLVLAVLLDFHDLLERRDRVLEVARLEPGDARLAQGESHAARPVHLARERGGLVEAAAGLARLARSPRGAAGADEGRHRFARTAPRAGEAERLLEVVPGVERAPEAQEGLGAAEDERELEVAHGELRDELRRRSVLEGARRVERLVLLELASPDGLVEGRKPEEREVGRAVRGARVHEPLRAGEREGNAREPVAPLDEVACRLLGEGPGLARGSGAVGRRFGLEHLGALGESAADGIVESFRLGVLGLLGTQIRERGVAERGALEDQARGLSVPGRERRPRHATALELVGEGEDLGLVELEGLGQGRGVARRGRESERVDERARVVRELLEAPSREPGEAFLELERLERRGVELEGAVGRRKLPLVRERGERLLGEGDVAVRLLGDLLGERAHLRQVAAQGGGDDEEHDLGRESLERELAHAFLRDELLHQSFHGTSRQFLVRERREEDERSVLGRVGRVISEGVLAARARPAEVVRHESQDLERERVRVVEVLDDRDERLLPRAGEERPGRGVHDPRALVLGSEGGRRRDSELGEESSERRREPEERVVLAHGLERVLDELEDRREAPFGGARFGDGRGARAPVDEPLLELADEARLPGARLARDDDEDRVVRLGAAPARGRSEGARRDPLEVGELVVASQEAGREDGRDLGVLVRLDREALVGALVEVADHGVRARRPLGRVAPHEREDQLLDRLGDRLLHLARRARWLRGEDLLGGLSLGDRMARRALVKDRAQGVEVGAPVDGRALEDLGRDEACLGEALGEALRGEAVVRELRRLPGTAARDDDRLGPERAVEEACSVEVLDPAERLDGDLGEERPRGARREAVEVGALEELRRVIEVASLDPGEVHVGDAVLEDPLEVRVVELGEGLELLLEVGEPAVAPGLLHGLDEDEHPASALLLAVLDEVDPRVAPWGELLEDRVASRRETPEH